MTPQDKLTIQWYL